MGHAQAPVRGKSNGHGSRRLQNDGPEGGYLGPAFAQDLWGEEQQVVRDNKECRGHHEKVDARKQETGDISERRPLQRVCVLQHGDSDGPQHPDFRDIKNCRLECPRD